MKLEYPQPQPIDDGEYGVLVSKGYGTPTGDICLDGGKWEMTLARVSAEDCDRLIKAAAEIKSRILDYRAEMTAPHGTKHFYKGRCQLCGKPEDDELHAEVITDSERTCPETNNGEHCTRGGDHGVHRDSNGDEWRTDGTATVTGERCLEHSDPADDLYGQCVKYGPHKMHENVHHQQWSKPFRPAPAPSPAGGPFWCPATTGPDDELDVTLYCDRDAGHPGSHHAPGPDEGSEVVWSDEPASVTS